MNCQTKDSMDTTPLISVILIFRDAERFIEEAIDSVLAQTCTNWELLLVDDGSKDGSAPIAQRYAAKLHEKARYLTHPGRENRGISASRNLGLLHARGDFVAFLDADDVWLPQKLQQQVTALNSQPSAAMVYGPTFEWHGWTGKRHDRDRDRLQDLDVPTSTLLAPTELVLAMLRNEACSPHLGSVLLRRNAVTAVNGFEPRFSGLYDDHVFFSKLGLSHPVSAIPECYDKYRQHPDSCRNAAVKAGTYGATRLAYLNWLEDYLEQPGTRKDNVWAMMEVKTALQEQRWPLQHPSLHWMTRKTSSGRSTVKEKVEHIAESILPISSRDWMRTRLRGPGSPPRVGRVHFGDLRRLMPISRNFGSDRGQPIDRYYVEQFLATHKADIRGNVLEIGDDACTRQFADGAVTKIDVLHPTEGNPKATIVADIAHATRIPDNSFHCVLLVQTLTFIYDTRAALHTVFRILKPGGVLLATVTGISHRSCDDWEDPSCWSFTTHSVRKLMEETFPEAEVNISAQGNVLAATAFLQGLAVEDLRTRELKHADPQYELVITVRAVKPLS